ncbi:MAG: AAA family ATPase [Oscillospiraceae bacterium]|nr:AAA family ATPase [Oscillospiraceae bacterium]
MAIHAIWGPPHSGKTTLAIDLASALIAHGQSVCLISPEPYSELSARLNINIPEDKSLGAAFSATTSLKHITYKVTDLFYVLAAPSYGGVFIEEVPSEDIKKMFGMIRGIYDYILVDCPPRMDSLIAAWALNLASTVLFLSGSQVASVLWHHTFKSAAESIQSKVVPICVMTSKQFNYQELSKAIEMVPQVTVPYYRDAEAEQNTHQTLYRSGVKGYSTSIDELIRYLKAEGRSV